MNYYQRTVQGHVLSVVGLKGGVGKTSIATNIGVGLAYAHPESKVAIVDANPLTGDLGPILNIRGTNSILDMADLIASGDTFGWDVVQTIVTNHNSGASLLLAPHYNQYNHEVHALVEDTMPRILNILQRYFHYIIVDTAAVIDNILVACVETSTAVLPVTTPSVLALKDTKIMLNELANIGILPEHTRLVLNMMRQGGMIKESHIEKFLSHRVDFQVPWDPYADEAINRATPLLTLSSQRAPGASALREMVKAISEQYKPQQETAYVPSGLGTKQLAPPYRHPKRDYISVMIADDQDEIRHLATRLIEVGQEGHEMPIRVDGYAATGAEAVDVATRLIPDVILMDINMPDMDGLQATKRILNEYPSTSIIIVTVHEGAEYWREAMKLGVADFIPKSSLGPQICQSIEDAYNRALPTRTRFY